MTQVYYTDRLLPIYVKEVERRYKSASYGVVKMDMEGRNGYGEL